MFVSRSPRSLAILGAVGAFAGIVAAVAVLSWERDVANSITVRQEGVVITEDSLEEALREASRRADFTVVAPKSSPQGMKVHDIYVHPELATSPGGPKSEFRLVTLQLEAKDLKFTIDELRGGFNPIITGVDLGDVVAGAKVYFDETDTAVIYSMLAKGRGFILSFPKESALVRDDAIALLSAFAAELP
jgi:hypothetical protein